VNDNAILCPSCQHLISGNPRYCPHCGVDVALAAVLEESQFAIQISSDSDMALTPEVLIPRLGERLVQKGVITAAQLRQALDYQQERAERGESCLLGQALLALGMVDQQPLDRAITEQIFQLQNALKDTNRHLEERVEQRTNELQKALQRLTELNQIKSNFISNVSHELRTPLAHIKGYLELLDSAMLGDLNTEQHKAVRTVLHATQRLEQLIESLLQFSLAARGELSLNIKTHDLAELVNTACAQVAPAVQRKQIELHCEIPKSPCWVQVDGDKITWVLMQLLDNAVKFTPEHGKVSVHLKIQGRVVDVLVSDTGIGIPPERIDEIFEPFHQLDEAMTRRYGGTGLGLALVKRILDAHSVPYKVQSRPGEGTQIEFSLPLHM